MSLRADRVILGILLGVAGVVLLLRTVLVDPSAPRIIGAALLMAGGGVAVALGSRSKGWRPPASERGAWYRDRLDHGLVILLGGVVLALWSVDLGDPAGTRGAATGFVLAGLVFTGLGIRARMR